VRTFSHNRWSTCAPQSDYKAIRKLIVNAILSTDMGVHKDLLARVVLRATRDAVRGAGAGGFSRASMDDRSLLVAYLLHCADLCVGLARLHAGVERTGKCARLPHRSAL
jgi:hypothetical protein